METGGPSALTIIFWVLAANVILILSAYGLVKLLRQRSQDSIQKIGEQIQEYAGQMNQLASFLHSYGGIDQEPYFTPLNELQSEASELESRLQQFLDTCRAFEEEIRAPGSNKLQEIINAPFVWFQRWRRSAALRQESVSISGQMDAAEQRMHNIYELPWELASECRQADRQYGELAEAARALQSAGVQGVMLQKIVSQLPLLQRSLNNVPEEFMEADQERLLAAANMEATIRVFEALNSLRPALNRYLPLVKEWQQCNQKASADYAELKQTGSKLRQALQNAPEGLIVAPLKNRLDQVAQLASEAGQTLTHPDAELLKPLSREVNQLLRVIQDTERQFHLSSQQLNELNHTLTRLKTDLEKLSIQYNDLEKRPIYPLVCDQSRNLLSEMRQRLTTLGPPEDTRTPDQIRQQLKESQQLRQELQALAGKAPETIAQYSLLVSTLESEQIKDGAGWLKKSREILAETDAYDLKNWPKQDSLPTLQIELEKLSQRHLQLVPADNTSQIMETELMQRLKNTRELAEQHKNLHPRIESIRSRLEKLQALEEESKEKLAEAWNALDQVDLLTESNPLLAEIAAEETDRLMEEIRVLGNEINARDQGEVEKKAQRANLQSDKVNQAFNQWLARLDSAVAERGKQMRDRLVEIDAIARLDDPQVEQVRQVLEKEEYLTAAARNEAGLLTSSPASSARAVVGRVAARIPRFEHKATFNNLEAMAEIKRKNDLWQTLDATQKGLEERSAPLLAAHQEASQSRSEAKERLADIEKVVTEKRAWPPSNQSSNQERQVINPIDEKWNGLKKQQVSAEWAILELGRLSQQYRLAAERVQNVLDRVRQDQEKVQDLEWQIESLKQRWLTQSEPSNPVMRESIRTLLSQSDSKLSFIKQKYLQGVLSYNQAVQNLQLLYDELHALETV
jgi:hypothetical protein